MKILIVSHEYPPIGGGGANACMNLTREYAAQGHEVTILTVWYEGLENTECIDGVNIIRIHSKRKYLDHCSFAEMLDYLLKAFGRIDNIVKKEQFDICQVFFAIPSGPIGYYLKKKYHIPYVIRFGGGDIPGFQKRFNIVYKFIAPFEKVLWKNADALIANSSGLKKMAMDFYDKCSIDIIPNGATKAIEVTNDLQTGETFRILFVSRLIERKGLQFIIPQLKGVAEKCNKKIKLIVVGEGPYRGDLEQLSKDYGVENIISFQGQKDKHELLEYYGNADAFILPSQKEGMPNVVLEAMSYGLPIVMTPCEGSQELIDGNGYVVKTEKFPNCLGELCNDVSKREKMGKRSKELIGEKFLWSSVAKQYLNLFERVRNK